MSSYAGDMPKASPACTNEGGRDKNSGWARMYALGIIGAVDAITGSPSPTVLRLRVEDPTTYRLITVLLYLASLYAANSTGSLPA